MKKEKCYQLEIYGSNKKRGVLKELIHLASEFKSKKRAVKRAREYINKKLPCCYEGTELSFKIKECRCVPLYIPRHRKRYRFRKRLLQIILHIEECQNKE